MRSSSIWLCGSTNSLLHLPAITHECEAELDLDIANEISDKMPNLCHLAPSGSHYSEELNKAGGPGMREMLNPTSAIMGSGLGDCVVLITDGRFSCATNWSCFAQSCSGREYSFAL